MSKEKPTRRGTMRNMHSNRHVNQRRFNPLDAVRDPDVYAFIRDLLTENYMRMEKIFPMGTLPVDIVASSSNFKECITAFVKLILNAARSHEGDPVTIAKTMNAEVFNFANPNGIFQRAFWERFQEFTGALREKETAYTDRFLRGPVIVDVGTGTGMYLWYLSRRSPPGKFVKFIGTDPYDYAEDFKMLAAADPRFRFIFQPTQLFPVEAVGRGRVNTVHLGGVIHHTFPEFQDPENPDSQGKVLELLESFHQVLSENGRLVIEEDGYEENPTDEAKVPARLRGASQMEFNQRFRALSREQKYKYFVWNDWYWNILTAGLYDMTMAYRYYTLEEWVRLFDEAGFHVVIKQDWGFLKTRQHGAASIFFVLEKRLRKTNIM